MNVSLVSDSEAWPATLLDPKYLDKLYAYKPEIIN